MRRSINWLIGKASRDTSSGRFIAEIDGLRFIAILWVVLFHLNWFIASKTGRSEGSDPLSEFLSHGFLGVQLFFVISGFVIALPFARGHLNNSAPPRLRHYFLRRMTRLEPPYIINLLLRFAMLPLLSDQTAGELFPHLLASMGYLHNIVYGCESSINFVAWSLEVELQFYLLAPFLASLFMIRSRLARRTALVLLIIAFSVVSYASSGSPRLTLSLVCALQYFLAGFLLLDLYLADWGQKPERSLRWDLASLLGWSGILLLPYLGRPGELFLVVPVFVAYVAAFKGKWSNRFFCQPLVYIIGGMCYTIYLYHYSIISALFRPLLQFPLLHRVPLWMELIAASLVLIPVLLLVSAIMFILIEKPCMKRDWYLKLLAWCRPGRKAAA